MVLMHLGDVCAGSLGVRILEVGPKIFDGGLECSDLSDEALAYRALQVGNGLPSGARSS